MRAGGDANQLLAQIEFFAAADIEDTNGALEPTSMTDPGMIASAQLTDAVRRALEPARSALSWWRHQLSQCVPARLRAQFGAELLLLRIRLPDSDSDGVTMQAEGFFRAEHLAQLPDCATALARAAALHRRWGPLLSLEVVLPASRCLIRQRELPRAAVERISKILTLELERTTPFASHDVRHAWRPTAPTPADGDTVGVMHVIAKRTLIDPLLAEARALKLAVAKVDVADANGGLLDVNLLGRNERPRSLLVQLNWAIGIAAVLCVGLTSLGLFAAFDRQQQVLADLATETAAARTEAEAMRKRQGDVERLRDRIAGLRQRRLNGARVVALWEEVTRLIPDSAWLTDMRLELDTLWIDGYARSAPELVGVLAQSPLFSGVALSSPVVREEARASERFQIRMKIEAARPKSVDQQEGR